MTQRHAWVALLCIAWIIPGVVGHDPWKPDEAYTFGVVYDMLRGGSWLVPTLTGDLKGCSFAPRCRRATAVCREAVPGLEDRGGGHEVACFNCGGA